MAHYGRRMARGGWGVLAARCVLLGVGVFALAAAVLFTWATLDGYGLLAPRMVLAVSSWGIALLAFASWLVLYQREAIPVVESPAREEPSELRIGRHDSWS